MPPAVDRCRDCVYFAGGECHAHPPTVLSKEDPGKAAKIRTAWPKVDGESTVVCEEFKRR